jgi:FkbM family methyltransferase
MMGRVIDRLRAFFRSHDPASDRLTFVPKSDQGRLLTARRREQRLRDQVAALRQKLAAAMERVHAAEEERARHQEESRRRRRRMLWSEVLRDLLPVRRAQLPLRAGTRDAPVRDARLRAVSDSYRGAIDGAAAPGELAALTMLDGLRWWVPIPSRNPDVRARYLAKEKLPYLGIVHGREVGIGGIMLDIGAHDGSTAIPRVLLGDVEACYCAEPDSLNYECLVANVVENDLRGLVLPDRIAIGAAEGIARLSQGPTSRGYRVLSDAGPSDGAIEVRVRTLDNWIRDLEIDPGAITFVKVDTQGFEVRVLQGAARLLAVRQSAWQLEVSPAMLQAAGNSLTELCALAQHHFTHFIDLSVEAPGKRRRPIGELPEALGYLGREGVRQTDILVYASPSR